MNPRTMNPKIMNRAVATIAAAVFSALIAACGSSNSGDGSSGQTAIEFYNELTDTKALLGSAVQVDLFANADTTATLTKQSYTTKAAGGAASVTVNNGKTSFTAKSSSNQNMVVQNVNNSLQTGKTYTSVLMGDLKAGQVNIQSYEQQTGTVASGKVSIRFIHALSLLNPSAIDLTTSSNSSIATGLAYGAASDYQTLSPSLGSLKINVAENGTTTSLSCKVTAGKSYDAILAYTSFKGSTIGLYCHELS